MSHFPKLLSVIAGTAFVGSAQAGLVAHFPVNSATDSSTFLDDVVDDATHGVADGTSSNEDGSIVFDATRGGDVLQTVQGHRFTAGTQDIDLSEGFGWSLWFKSPSANFNIDDAGADVIIGSRNGIWNKVQPTGTERFFDLGGYNIDDGAWHHIAYVGDSTDGGAIWIDGVQVATDATPFNGTQTVNDVMEIGGSSRFSEDATGFMDEIRIFDHRLSESEIQALAIPEPSSLALLGLGGLLIARRRRG